MNKDTKYLLLFKLNKNNFIKTIEIVVEQAFQCRLLFKFDEHFQFGFQQSKFLFRIRDLVFEFFF